MTLIPACPGTPPVELCCPNDGAPLIGRVCSSCQTIFPVIEYGGRDVIDFRMADHPADVSLTFTIPVEPLPQDLRKQVLKPERWMKGLLSREDLRRKYGTKLSLGYQHHLLKLRRERGTDLRILDHGCGSGGNRGYLKDIGFRSVVGIDWCSPAADFLADAHRLPFADRSFDVVLSTAVLEHCYFPHLAMREIARVLKPGGTALVGLSFWESWHGESFFHFTPNGVYALCAQSDLVLKDLWSGWGFIPAVLTHAMTPKLRRTGYMLQAVWDFWASRLMGRRRAYKKKISTSGSLQFRADRPF